jgi:hypothetical protein
MSGQWIKLIQNKLHAFFRDMIWAVKDNALGLYWAQLRVPYVRIVAPGIILLAMTVVG